ncbi:MAG: peptidoglycan DD-metalloendopeptidase family protein [Acidimicrobiia bacterium]
MREDFATLYTNKLKPKNIKRLRLISSCLVSFSLIMVLYVTPAYSETTPTTTPDTTTTVAPVPTTGGSLDADLPGATTLPPSGPSKLDSVAQQNIKKANSKLDKATKDLLDAQLAVDTTANEIQNTKALLLTLEDQIAKNTALLAVQELPLEQLSKIIKKRAVTLYQNSDGKPTSAIEQFYYNRQVALSGKAQNANMNQFKTYNKKVKRLKRLKKTLNDQQNQAITKQVDLENLSIEFAAKLETAKKAYEKSAVVFLDANAKIGVKLAIDGKMCPIAGPITHTDDWGNPRSGGRTHKGNDIFSAYGTPNVAIVSGRAERNFDDLGGMGINLWGDDGNMYYYAHLSAFAGENNRRVNQGEVVGYTGDSGNAQGGAPHTHFEIRVGGTQQINPYPTIRIICGV